MLATAAEDLAPERFPSKTERAVFEHMVGVRRAAIVVAINAKPKAPIFKAADYGIVAD